MNQQKNSIDISIVCAPTDRTRIGKVLVLSTGYPVDDMSPAPDTILVCGVPIEREREVREKIEQCLVLMSPTHQPKSSPKQLTRLRPTGSFNLGEIGALLHANGVVTRGYDHRGNGALLVMHHPDQPLPIVELSAAGFVVEQE